MYLHGIGDNRSGAAGVVERFGPQGFEVVAYDSRAHGQSDGTMCTYGIRERQDLRRVIATIPAGPVILVGSSLGAAVAIQTASVEPRVSGVVAVASARLVNVPVLLLHGADDRETSPRHSRLVHDALAGLGHLPLKPEA